MKLRHALTALVAAAALLVLPAAGLAATTTFGSPLAVPATEDTASNLAYTGTSIPTIDPGPPPHQVIVRVAHDGADTALWAGSEPDGTPRAPAAGQVTSQRLEGCARPAPGGPAPNAQIHFQDVVPQADGSFRVDVTTQSFEVPVCGQPDSSGAAAGPTTITTFQPTNFCVNAGDAVDFNDEGGFDPKFYPSGVPFQVLGAVGAASTYSFIRDNQTNNGSSFAPGDVTNHDGFQTNPGLELMLQATLATGPDATPLCPGGTSGVKAPTPPAPQAGAPGGPPALVLRKQTDGVNHARWVSTAVYCARPSTPCTGQVTLLSAAGGAAKVLTLGRGQLIAPPHQTVHVRMRLSPAALVLIRRHHRRLAATLQIHEQGGSSFTQAITLKI